jgi:SagB-type dehydrogenase family enzyme
MRHSILFHFLTGNKKNLRKSDDVPAAWKVDYYKEYPRLPQLVLPEPRPLGGSLAETLLKRKSERSFDPEGPISLGELSDFLYWSAGIKEKSPNSPRRMYPSGGARYPLEIYPIVFRADGFKNAVYHYAPLGHKLEEIADASWLEKTAEIIFEEKMQKAAVIFIITAVFERTMMKYQEFGYRLILEEAGHLCQNFYLVAAAMDLAGCGLGGFSDKLANQLLEIDGKNEGAVYAFAFGKNKQDVIKRS